MYVSLHDDRDLDFPRELLPAVCYAIILLKSRWACSRIEYHQHINKFLADKIYKMFKDQNSNKHKIPPVSIVWNNTTVDEIKKCTM